MLVKNRVNQLELVCGNFIKFFSLLSDSTKKKDQLYSYQSALPHPIYKGIFPDLNENNLTKQNIVESIDLFNGESFTWWRVSKQIHTDKSKLLLDNGFEQGPLYTGMVYDISKDLSKTKCTPMADTTISVITHPEGLTEWIYPIQVSFDFSQAVADGYRQIFQNHFNTIDCQHVAVVKNNQIIGTGSVFFDENVCGFYNLSVLPEYRHQHVAANIHYFRLQLAKKRNASYVILHASEMAYHLGKLFGFKEVAKFIPYFYNLK